MLQSKPVGSDHRFQSDFTLARSVLPAVACYCPRLSVRLHVSFSSLQRIKCIPKPTAKLRASASLQVLAWSSVSTDSLRRSRRCTTGYQVTNCVPATGIIRTVRGNSRSLITSYITTYAFCSSIVCSHQWHALGSFQTVKTESSNLFPKCDL